MIEIISATRFSFTDFNSKAPLGLSLSRLLFDCRVSPSIAYDNREGLPEIYNNRIKASNQDLLVFVHDDVSIDDFFLVDHLIEGLSQFDVIGVAGNRRRVPQQPAWHVVDDNFSRDDPKNLSGAVAHGASPFGGVTYYEAVPAECELLDDVFLAAKKETLITKSLNFDPRFEFHFYDLDFCRTARSKGLRLGTWSIPLTHSGRGNYGTPSWTDMRDRYRDKWQD